MSDNSNSIAQELAKMIEQEEVYIEQLHCYLDEIHGRARRQGWVVSFEEENPLDEKIAEAKDNINALGRV